MDDPLISIDRASRSYAIFDGMTKIDGFHTYTDEQVALDTAKTFLKRLTNKEPRIVYPKITRYARS